MSAFVRVHNANNDPTRPGPADRSYQLSEDVSDLDIIGLHELKRFERGGIFHIVTLL